MMQVPYARIILPPLKSKFGLAKDAFLIVGGKTKIVGASPMIFSVMEKAVSEAKKAVHASEKSILIPETAVSSCSWMFASSFVSPSSGRMSCSCSIS
jgi:hypothetical protein